MLGYIKRLFVDTWANTEKLSIENNSSFQNKFVNVSTIIILIYVAFGISLIKYYGNISSISILINGKSSSSNIPWFRQYFYGSDIGTFHQKLYWISSIVLIYLLIPVLIIKFGFKQRLKDYGLSFNNVHKDYPIYIIMLLVMLPIVYIASSTQAFQNKYPLFQPTKEPLFPLFIWWQMAYLIQFVAVEFFYRGFIIHGLKNRFGFYSIFVSTIPYCMIHFGKPFAETISAIIAGIVLGTLSLKSRSIFLGVLIHYSIAITMDLLALYQEGIL